MASNGLRCPKLIKMTQHDPKWPWWPLNSSQVYNSYLYASMGPFWPKISWGQKRAPILFLLFLVQLSARVILIHAESFWAILIDFVPFKDICVLFWIPWGGPIWHIIMYYVPENCHRVTRIILGLVGPFSPLLMILGHFRPFWAILGHTWVP